MSTPIDLQPGTLPYSCYPPDPQTLNEDIINATQAQLDQNFPGIVVGADEPAPEFQDRVWFRTTDLHWYYYSGGHWVRPHSTPPNGSERRLWVGAESDVWSYDGGSGDDPSVVIPIGASGAMWEVDHSFDARFPLAPGTLPSATVINVTDTGGEERHTLTATEGPSHAHVVNTTDRAIPSTLWSHFDAAGEVPSPLPEKPIAPDATGTTTPLNALTDPTWGQPHNNMPPYYGAFFIKRTGRTLFLA